MENKQRQILPSIRFDNPVLGLPQRGARRYVPGNWLGLITEGIIPPEPFSSQEEARKYIEDRITQRRNEFIGEYQRGEHGTQALTYVTALDTEVYKEARKYKHLNPEAYKKVIQGLNYLTRDNMTTGIGERLNVGISLFRYDMKFTDDGVGVLYGQGIDEPLIPMIARGRDCRDEVGTDIDHPRQEAEVTQFERIQEVLGKKDTPPGTTIVSFSPPGKEGSSYAHNFYDVFILKEDANKERYVEARRYASGLSIEESLKKADELQPGYTADLKPDEQHVDAFLISRPVVLTEDSTYFNNPDQLHKDLQADPKAMSYKEFNRKVVQDEVFTAMLDEYIHTLEEKPEDTRLLDRIRNAIMNRADETVGLRQPVFIPRRHTSDSEPSGPLPIMVRINHYGMQQVRETTTGCGMSSGTGQESARFGQYGISRMPSNMSSFKSTDVASGEDKYGARSFECPECNHTNTRPYNELIPACQHCGSTKVAC